MLDVKRDRRGFALPAAIGALVIIGTLITAGFYMARQELRIGVASHHANLAVNLAQAGAHEVMANWNGYQLGNIPVWGDTTIVDSTDVGIWSVNITNANNVLYYLDATGRVTQGGALRAGAERNLGIITRLIYADISPPAALTTRGGVSLNGGALINGTDIPPIGWAGYCSSTTDKTGLITNDTSEVSTGGTSFIGGLPPYDQDSTLVDSTFTNFGEMDWDALSTLAQLDGKDITSVGTTINQTGPSLDGSGQCNEAVLSNWGDTLPSAPCGSYFPLIYHGGPELRIQSGGIGQGILLVDGDLNLRGNFVFYGIIIVQGTFETQGSGNRIVGAVMASNASVEENQTVTGTSAIQYSSCAVQRAILNNASMSRARPLAERSWIDLSALLK